MVTPNVHSKQKVRKPKRKLVGIKKLATMSKTSKPRPVNAPSTTGKPSGGGRGNNPPTPKPKK